MTKFFQINKKFVGAFDGATPPAGAIEVSTPPSDGRLEWDGSNWVEPVALKDQFLAEARQAGYVAKGVTSDAMVFALWEKIVEGRSESADALQSKREQVKADHPKK